MRVRSARASGVATTGRGDGARARARARARTSGTDVARRGRAIARAFGFSSKSSAVVERDAVTPGKGPGSPRWGEIHAYLARGAGRAREATAEDVAAIVRGKRRGVVVDVRQPLEYEEWRLVGTKSAPYLVPMANALRRASGYFLSIKGGLKERNASFVERVDELTNGSRRETVILLDLRGGDLSIAPNTGSTSVSDRGDSLSLRAAYELVQAGYTDVRYVVGGIPALIDDGGLPYESEKYGDLLRFVGDRTRRTLMYSNLLPDPSLAPGVLVQLVLLLALAVFQGASAP